MPPEKPLVIVTVGGQNPSFSPLARNIGLAKTFPLGVERVEFHVEAFLARFARYRRHISSLGAVVLVPDSNPFKVSVYALALGRSAALRGAMLKHRHFRPPAVLLRPKKNPAIPFRPLVISRATDDSDL